MIFLYITLYHSQKDVISKIAPNDLLEIKATPLGSISLLIIQCRKMQLFSFFAFCFQLSPKPYRINSDYYY